MLLEIREGSFAFDKDKMILERANLGIERGQHTSLSGPSGTGKSTVLMLLANLLSLDAGEIYFENRPMTSYPYPLYRQEVSYVMQNPVLFGQTVEDNLAFPAEIRGMDFDRERARSLMDRLHLKHVSMEQNVTELSGGEAQRVGLIRNLMFPPKLLLLDEVTASLDEDNSENLWKLLFELAEQEDMTMVWVSHKREDRERAKQQLVMNPRTRQFERVH